MDWRSLALRDEAMALCDPAVDMVLWKLAPINDISKVPSQYIPEYVGHERGQLTEAFRKRPFCVVFAGRDREGQLSTCQRPSMGKRTLKNSSLGSAHRTAFLVTAFLVCQHTLAPRKRTKKRRHELLRPPEELTGFKTILGSAPDL